MDKIFNLEIDGQITLPDGSTLGPLEETTVNVVQTSEGGGGMMVAHLTFNENNDTYSCDKTYAEISAAFPNVMLEVEVEGPQWDLLSPSTRGSNFYEFRNNVMQGVNGIRYLAARIVTIYDDEFISHIFSEKQLT